MLLATKNGGRAVLLAAAAFFKLELLHGKVNLAKDCLTTEELKNVISHR
jgi:hypothetical protein